VFGIKTPKGPKHDSQNQLRLFMSEGGESCKLLVGYEPVYLLIIRFLVL
jgi:hypothetical protein